MPITYVMLSRLALARYGSTAKPLGIMECLKFLEQGPQKLFHICSSKFSCTCHKK